MCRMAWVGLLLGVMTLSGCATGSHFDRWAGHDASAIRVRPGDTLYSIAVANDLDWRDVARWNGIRNPRDLRAGQILRLTPPGQTARAAANTPPRAVPHQPSATKPTSRSASPRSNASVSSQGVAWQWPVNGRVLSRFIDQSKQQKGLILAGQIGEPVRASAAGEVVYAGNGLPGYGNLLIIKHNSTWLSAYGYNRSLLVKEGQSVRAGQVVATMGRRDGRAKDKTGSLLFQIRRDGKPVDPMAYLPSR
ncbi:peptidoglycan DD-metalloendopeptidase family protein [Halothiobacillus sp.]|uniref:peptidoglycan DD-metalloendopeptidase family protein n=1 Tax=Halothiobacillus sp. TaxID=1891311 RepID=UPI00262E630B|nr:peptidoglycan DD-metalloendopeptidase family protein [Halothiobacillus sp.]